MTVLKQAPKMGSREFAECVDALGLNLDQAAEFLCVSRRQVQRYANQGDVPMPTAILLRLMLATKLSPVTVTAVTSPGRKLDCCRRFSVGLPFCLDCPAALPSALDVVG